MPEKKTTEPTNPSNRQKSAKINTTSTAKPVENRFGNQNTTDNTSTTPVKNLPKKVVVTSTNKKPSGTFLDRVLNTSTPETTTPSFKTGLVKAISGQPKESSPIMKAVKESQPKITQEQIAARDQELKKLSGSNFDIDALFTATKQDYGDVIYFGNTFIKNKEELEAVLADPFQRDQFFIEKKSELGKYFQIANAKDFDAKIAGGLSEYEKTQFTDYYGKTIYDPVFTRQTPTPGQLGYRAEFDMFAPDPVQATYNIAQRKYEAQNQFDKLKSNGIAVDAYGQPFEDPAKFYSYIKDPLNRDAYQRKYGKQLKEIGYSTVNDLLKSVVLDSSVNADWARSEDYRKMRIAKGSDVVKKDFIGKSGTIYDENSNAGSISNISEKDLGRILYEYDLGNEINIDVPSSTGRSIDYQAINRNSMVDLLSKQGIREDEIDEILNDYKLQYERSMGVASYENKRKQLGFYKDSKGVMRSKYDENRETQALSSLSDDERKISGLYDQIREIYAAAPKANGKQQRQLGPDQLKKVNSIKAQIEQIKRDSGFFGFNAIPKQEFLDAYGNRLEGKDQEKAQVVFVKTMQSEKKTDLVILKEKRNVLYEQVEELEKRVKEFKDYSKVAVYNEEGLDERYDEAVSRTTPFIWQLLNSRPTMQMLPSDQEKANYIYMANLTDKINEKKAQIKAINKLVYTNADLTKIDGTGVGANIFAEVSKGAANIAGVFTGDKYMTPAEELTTAVQVLQENGMYVNPDITKRLSEVSEDQMMAQGFVGSIGAALQLGIYGKGIAGGLSKVFASEAGLATRTYMASRYGKTGLGAFQMFEKAAVEYGIDFLSYEMAGEDGTSGVAEKLGTQVYDKVTGILKLGRFIPNNIIGKMFTYFGRTVSGAAGSFTEETFANVWTNLKENGFDVKDAVINAYGKTEDERLFTLRSIAFTSLAFSTMSVGNLGVLFKTRREFADYLTSNYGENISETDREILELLDTTIKNSRGGDDDVDYQTATATVAAVDGRGNTTAIPLDQSMVMSSGPVESDQKTTTSSAASSGAGSEGVQVEKRTGNMGEEFYVAGVNGVLDNKVIYRYNSETGQLEAKGLTSTTEEFVPVNEKAREFIEGQSKEHGIVSREKIENIAIKNLEARRKSQADNERATGRDNNKVSYQNQTETSRRKKERIDKVEASARARYNPKFDADGQARTGLFTGVAEEVKVSDTDVKDTASEISRNMGSKMKINLTSFFMNGKAVITDLARKKAAKVADYMAPLFKDFDNTLFTTEDTDMTTGQPIRERNKDAVTDKVREAVARNSTFNDIFGQMVSEGRMSKEDAIDNFIINLLQNSRGKAAEIFGNDKVGFENFQKLRKDFNNFTANKYTGSNTFSATDKFVRQTPMATTTTKNRKADYKKQAAELVKENQRRREVAQILQNTQEEGAFIKDEQIDAARFLNGEITAQEFMENTGEPVASTTDPAQVEAAAKAKAQGMVDMTKYNEAIELIRKNDATRDKYRKELLKKGAEVWGFTTSIKRPFQWKQDLKRKRFVADVSMRHFEAAATRAGITLQQFMDTRIEMLKRTEQQFQEWLKMSPELVPLYQLPSTLVPEEIYPNMMKAMQLKEKEFSPEKIALMTGIVFNEQGEAIAFDPTFKIDNSISEKNLRTKLQEVFDFARYKKVTNSYGNVKRFPYVPSFGKRQSFQEVQKYFKMESLIPVSEHDALYSNYPDLALVGIRVVDDSNLPDVSFSPNNTYTGKGKSQTSPGTILINISRYRDSIKNPKEFQREFEKGMSPRLQKALRESILFMEEELSIPESRKFATPTAVRGKVYELKSAGIIDDHTEKLINDVVDFYADKNLFQFGSYTNVFSDISKVLFLSRDPKSIAAAIETFSNGYDLTEADSKALELIYNRYFDAYGPSSTARLKSIHNAFITTKRFAGLNTEELISAEIEPKREVLPLKVPTTFTIPVDFDTTEIGSFVDFCTSGQMANLIQIIKDNDLVVSDFEMYLGAINSMGRLATRLQKSRESGQGLSDQEISLIQNEIDSGNYFRFSTFFEKILNQDEFDFPDGSRGPLFDLEQLMSLEQEDGIVIPEISNLDLQIEEIVDKYDNYIYTLPQKSDSTFKQMTDSEARGLFYDMFPGIENFANGIYDPYKKVSDFTKQELQAELVDKGLVSQETFDKIYSQYESNPESFTGSAASNFVDNLKKLTTEEQKVLSDKIKIRRLVEKNIGMAFYSNTAYAAAKVIEQAVSKDKILTSNLRGLLKNNGARDNELNWIGFDDFIERNQGKEFITSRELMDWASNIPTITVYDQESAGKKRTVSDVVLLGFTPKAADRAGMVKSEFSRRDPTLDYYDDMDESGNPAYRFFDQYPIAIKRSDGTVSFISMGEIMDDSIELYEKYAGREEFATLKKALEDLRDFDTNDLSDKNKQHLKSLVKIYAETSDELSRIEQDELFFGHTIQFPGTIKGSYKEHLISVPLSSNRLLRDYDDKIIDIISKLSELEKSFNGKKPSSLIAQEINQLENQLHSLVDTRNSLRRDYYNARHFKEIVPEVAMHMRTQIIVTPDGERVLYVQEMQSDKVQDFRQDILTPIKDKYRDVSSEILMIGNKANVNFKGDVEKVRSALKESGYSDEQINRYLARDKEVKDAIDAFKKTTPITESNQYVELGIKHAMKIASDYGVKKIVFSNGQAAGQIVGATNAKQSAGLNTLYNKAIPSALAKLASKDKFNYTIGTIELNRIEEAKPKYPVASEITLDTTAYPTYVNKEGETVENTGSPIPLSDLDPKFANEVGRSYIGEGYIPSNSFNTIELTDETLNKVTEGMALFQGEQGGAHGATVKTDQGKHIIFALTNPNVTTAMHELAHVWESYMTATERQMFMDSVGHSDWTRETSEAFARGFEKYLYDGKAPSGSLTKMFEDFKRWLIKVYGGIKGTPVEMEISEPMRKMYDAMLGEARVNDLKQRKSTDIFDDISEFIKEIKGNPEFEGITDSELYAALMRSGFEPSDVQDYFSLKQRANIAKQQQGKGMFKDEADVMESEEEAMRVVRSQKELIDEIENMDPNEYPVILQTLADAIEDGDVPLAKAIQDLIAAKHSKANPQKIADKYSNILKMGTDIGRMLQLFRQLTKDTYLTSAEGMFRRNEKKGLYIPDKAKEKIRDMAVELDRIKELYKQSRAAAESDPFGISSADPSKTNLQYHTGLYEQMQEATKRFIDARQPYEGDDSLIDMYRTFVKGGLMTPGSISVNTLSNVTKFLTGVIVDPLKSAISFSAFKLGISEKQFTKTSLKDWWSGVRYGMPMGLKRAYKILKDGTMTQAYQNPDSYVQGYSFYKSFAKFWGLKLDQYRVAAGYSDMTNEELAEKHGFKLGVQGEIPKKQQAIAALQGFFGVVPDVIFRVMGATDAVFRDFAYFSTVSEQFKMTKEHDRYQQAIKNATGAEKSRLKAEYDAVRKAYIHVNSDFQNTKANEEAMRYVYNNDNYTTDAVQYAQGFTRRINQNSFIAKTARLVGTSIIPFTRIPSNYALELMEFFLPEYALIKLAANGAKAYTRSRGLQDASSAEYAESLSERRDNARSLDRVLARALVGTGVQFIAVQMVKAGAVSGAPDDENEKDPGASMTYSYVFERPYSINITLVKERFKEMLDPNYKSNRNDLWDKENDLIIDYRALGIFGAALYMQYKENKLMESSGPKYQNRGDFNKITDEFTMSLFGNYGSAGKYILDQTFVRGLLSLATAVTAEDENKMPAFLADITLTLSAGMVPNSLAWMDKWRRQYMVDYDAKEAPAFKAFGMEVESTFATMYWRKLATKMAERWPIGNPDQYVDLPFISSEGDNIPPKYDAFGKAVLQTPTGATMGSWLYNTFDVFKATRAVAGYDTPDWESLCYLVTKKGDAWNCLPSLPPRKFDTPSGPYKFAPEEYNNYLQYSTMITRQLVQKYIIDKGIYKKLIDVNSKINKNPRTGLPITGVKENINVLQGYVILGGLLQKLNAAGRDIAEVATYSWVDEQRRKMYLENPKRYTETLIDEALSPVAKAMGELYTYAGINKADEYLSIDMDMISDPERFKQFVTGAMELFKEYNQDPRTAIVTGRNAVSSQLQNADGDITIPFEEATKKSAVVDTLVKQRKEAQKQATPNLSPNDNDATIDFD